MVQLYFTDNLCLLYFIIQFQIKIYFLDCLVALHLFFVCFLVMAIRKIATLLHVKGMRLRKVIAVCTK